MSKTKKASEVQLMEAFAFILFSSGLMVDKGAHGEAPVLWRSDKNLRNDYRAMASDLIKELTNVGVGLRPSASPKIIEFLEILVTEPPRPAYPIEEAEKAFMK